MRWKIFSVFFSLSIYIWSPTINSALLCVISNSMCNSFSNLLTMLELLLHISPSSTYISKYMMSFSSSYAKTHKSAHDCLKPKSMRNFTIRLFHCLEACFNPYKLFLSKHTRSSWPNPLSCSMLIVSSRFPCRNAVLTSNCNFHNTSCSNS